MSFSTTTLISPKSLLRHLSAMQFWLVIVNSCRKNSGHINTNPGFQGLVYLHDTCQLVHGALTTRSCFVTKYWTIKLSDYGLNDVIDELIQNEMIMPVGERTIDGYFRIFL